MVIKLSVYLQDLPMKMSRWNFLKQNYGHLKLIQVTISYDAANFRIVRLGESRDFETMQEDL